ncbi:uncharacterized protein RJT20DRAFT_16752 [Scheffersomyces xylosifermentans]|uniref:uncharacterized protein n=1 Tax=Scheffersomyces xylosifermentans TaxID=1304137 RepID=UPI00315D5D6B
MVDINVNGKVALITGGSRGIGYYIAESFVLNGASTIIITSRKQDACDKAKAELDKLSKENGKKVTIISLACNIADDKAFEKFYQEVSTKIDKLDILISNAGAAYGETLLKHPIGAVRKVLDLNVTAVFQSVQLFHPLLVNAGTKEDPARIIITSSVAASIATDFGGTYGYLASKAAVSHLGKNLATQLGPQNINVNIIAPGIFPTKMSKYLVEEKTDTLINDNPKRRYGRKEDIQNAVLWLCSQQSNYINGISLPIDGGLYLVGTSKLSKF